MQCFAAAVTMPFRLGENLLISGYGEWGRKMQTDLSDGVRYLADQGIVDRNRVCMTGASYGGYAAMAGVTLQSGIYRCAVAVAGVSDLRQMLLKTATRSAVPTMRRSVSRSVSSGPGT